MSWLLVLILGVGTPAYHVVEVPGFSTEATCQQVGKQMAADHTKKLMGLGGMAIVLCVRKEELSL